MKIQTGRFLLRDFIDDDIQAFEAYHDDPRSKEFYDEQYAEEGYARQLVRLFQDWALEKPRRNYQFAILRKDQPELLIGCCGLRTKSAEPGTAELGIELSPACWSRFAYALEVLQALLEFGFGCLELRMAFGITVSDNARIGRLVSSLGAKAVSRPTPDWMRAKGWTEIEWQITKEQWDSFRHRRRLLR